MVQQRELSPRKEMIEVGEEVLKEATSRSVCVLFIPDFLLGLLSSLLKMKATGSSKTSVDFYTKVHGVMTTKIVLKIHKRLSRSTCRNLQMSALSVVCIFQFLIRLSDVLHRLRADSRVSNTISSVKIFVRTSVEEGGRISGKGRREMEEWKKVRRKNENKLRITNK
jgi:hypothetical protein